MRQASYILVLFLCASCKTTESKNAQLPNLNQIAEDKLGKTVQRKDNGGYAMFYTDEQTPRWKSVLILNTKNGSVVYGPERMNAEVTWHSQTQLKIKEYPERIRDASSSNTYTYYYDFIKKQKVTSIER